MKVLIVEDDTVKYGRLHVSLTSDGMVPGDIVHAVCAADALSRLQETRFDLMLLDVNLPRRLGEQPVRGGGIEVLREIARNSEYHPPRYVVGVTAFQDAVEEFGSEFED